MTINDLKSALAAGFNPAAATHFNATLAFSAEDQRLVVHIHDGELSFPEDISAADVTFLFPSFDMAWKLFSGQVNPMEAFMAGDFRSDGFLLWG
ncbi:MAG: SCP2 sterol-binding domain-containing protein, partial [Proteobacteria bacterium]|nr:SCP2 sterol-binding domain-containing protein [Pseudomonadota bacterium]